VWWGGEAAGAPPRLWVVPEGRSDYGGHGRTRVRVTLYKTITL
jgi:hypothetical protein